jgi:hypothetical protein
MSIRILESAKLDLTLGFHFYENQEEGLGFSFLDSLFADIDSLQLYAGIHAKVFGFHRSLAARFPFAIYYSLEANEVFVHAVLDCREDPERTQDRLRNP